MNPIRPRFTVNGYFFGKLERRCRVLAIRKEVLLFEPEEPAADGHQVAGLSREPRRRAGPGDPVVEQVPAVRGEDLGRDFDEGLKSLRVSPPLSLLSGAVILHYVGHQRLRLPAELARWKP